MRPIPELPAERRGVFTSAEAVSVGWSRSALDRAVRSGRLVRLDRDAYALPLTDTGPEADRLRFAMASVAAVLAVRPAVGSHRSSAVLADLPLWTTPDRAGVTVPPRYTGDAQHSHLHRATLRPIDVLRGVVDRTGAARTVTDIARESGLREAVVVGDAALRRGLTDLDRIAHSAAFCTGWPGYRRAHAILNYLDGRSESPLESVSRLQLAFTALPRPEPQVEIFDLTGFFRGRVDFYWDEFGVVGEVDGKVKYRERPEEALLRQERRERLLTETGLIMVRWGRADLAVMPFLISRLTDAFMQGTRRRSEDRRWIARPTGLLAPRITA